MQLEPFSIRQLVLQTDPRWPRVCAPRTEQSCLKQRSNKRQPIPFKPKENQKFQEHRILSVKSRNREYHGIEN
eukprot:6208862-Amphidinium_carterae.1